MNTAPFFALALLASLTPAQAQVQPPAAGYHGIQIPSRPQPRPTAPPAARARDQRDVESFNRVVPEGAGDPNDPVLSRPHVLLLSVHPNTTDMSAGKTPTPSGDRRCLWRASSSRAGTPRLSTGRNHDPPRHLLRRLRELRAERRRVPGAGVCADVPVLRVAGRDGDVCGAG